METCGLYPVYTFTAKDKTINGRYFVAADDENCAKKYIDEINHNVSPIEIDIESCTEFKNLKYICPFYNNGINAICVINALKYYPY